MQNKPRIHDPIEGVCRMLRTHMTRVDNTIYVIGGHKILTDNPGEWSSGIANSHLYTLDLSKSVNLETDWSSVITATRLPNDIPPIEAGIFFRRGGKLVFAGIRSVHEDVPILAENGMEVKLQFPPLNKTFFIYDLQSQKWTPITEEVYGATGQPRDPAFAFEGDGDGGNGVFWTYGETSLVGDLHSAGDSMELWRFPGRGTECNITSEFTPCEQITSRSDQARELPRGTGANEMVFLDIRKKRYPDRYGGVLILLGQMYVSDPQSISLKYVNIYDVATNTWYSQLTTAQDDIFPIPRTDSCAVIASAPDGTSHNIYYYGGRQHLVTPNGYTSTGLYGGLWILTLPSFHWIQVDNLVPRWGQTCTKIHEKYMVMQGGWRGNTGEHTCDPHVGFQFLDLNTLKLTREMNLENATYQVPPEIYRVIGGNADGGAEFDSPRGGFIDRELYNIFHVEDDKPLGELLDMGSKPTGARTGVILMACGAFVQVLILISWLYLRRRYRNSIMHKPISESHSDLNASLNPSYGAVSQQCETEDDAEIKCKETSCLVDTDTHKL